MVTVEIAHKILEHEGYSGSMLNRAIEANVLETMQYENVFSSYNYAITRDSFHDYLYELKFPERKIDDIMDNI